MANMFLRGSGVLLGLFAAVGSASAREDPVSPTSSQQLVLCESRNQRKAWCSSSWPLGQVVLERVVSNAPCIQGRSWGFDQTGVWVDQGCRASFRLISGHPETTLVNIPCNSENQRPARCETGLNIISARVRTVQSHAPCIEGQSWGVEDRAISVRNGCRATFVVAGTRP